MYSFETSSRKLSHKVRSLDHQRSYPQRINNNMATLLGFCFTILVAVSLFMNPRIADASKEFKVGESGVWQEPDANDTQIYNQWAAHNRFRVGDSIYFAYKNDSVLVVDKWYYYHCNTSKPISAFNDGKTLIKLDKPGPFYFISAALNHCKNGQRMLINVLGLHPTPDIPPAIAVPPQVYVTDSPSPSPKNPNSGVSVTIVTLIPIVLALATITVVSMPN